MELRVIPHRCSGLAAFLPDLYLTLYSLYQPSCWSSTRALQLVALGPPLANLCGDQNVKVPASSYSGI